MERPQGDLITSDKIMAFVSLGVFYKPILYVHQIISSFSNQNNHKCIKTNLRGCKQKHHSPKYLR